MKRTIVMALLGVSLMFAQVHTKPPAEVHANCCLCLCRAKDETKCSAMCIRLQHGKKIVEEPQMLECTAACKKVHVKTIETSRFNWSKN
jgi:hypothetical protein